MVHQFKQRKWWASAQVSKYTWSFKLKINKTTIFFFVWMLGVCACHFQISKMHSWPNELDIFENISKQFSKIYNNDELLLYWVLMVPLLLALTYSNSNSTWNYLRKSKYKNTYILHIYWADHLHLNNFQSSFYQIRAIAFERSK